MNASWSLFKETKCFINYILMIIKYDKRLMIRSGRFNDWWCFSVGRHLSSPRSWTSQEREWTWPFGWVNVQQQAARGELWADVCVCLQDTAGQERFHALGPIYYRDSNGAVLVYDVTDEDSFQKVPVAPFKLTPPRLITMTGQKTIIPVCVAGEELGQRAEENVGQRHLFMYSRWVYLNATQEN